MVRSRIFLVEDHAEVRKTLADFLNGQADFEVCGDASSGAEAITAVEKLRPEVVVVDMSMPDTSGVELIKLLRKRSPEARLLIFSAHPDAVYAEQALKAGALGYVSKMDPPALLDAIRSVLKGEIYLSERMRTRIDDRSAGS